MNHTRRKIPPLRALLFLLASVMPCFAANLIDEGRQDAVADCSACHRVTADQRPPAPVPDPDEIHDVLAPSFDVIARRYAGKRAALRAIIQAPRHPMREQQFLKRDLTAITEYIGSLRSQDWK
jgi:hypothetical protein